MWSWFFWGFGSFPSASRKWNCVSLNKTKQNEKKILWVNDFPCIPYYFFSLNCYLLPFLQDWALAYSQETCLSQGSFLSSFPLAFIWHENWKNAFCCCEWLMVMRTSPYHTYTKGVKNIHFPLIRTWFSLVVRFYFQLWSFKSRVPFSAALNASGSSASLLPMCKSPTTNFRIALHAVACFVLGHKVPSQLGGYYSISLPSNNYTIYW